MTRRKLKTLKLPKVNKNLKKNKMEDSESLEEPN
jgi:hypothetical protein